MSACVAAQRGAERHAAPRSIVDLQSRLDGLASQSPDRRSSLFREDDARCRRRPQMRLRSNRAIARPIARRRSADRARSSIGSPGDSLLGQLRLDRYHCVVADDRPHVAQARPNRASHRSTGSSVGHGRLEADHQASAGRQRRPATRRHSPANRGALVGRTGSKSLRRRGRTAGSNSRSLRSSCRRWPDSSGSGSCA